MERAELKSLLASTGCAVERGDFIFLVDSNWSAAERAEANAIMAQLGGQESERGWLCIPTGGSSGKIRFARHDEFTLSAAVSGFRLHCGIGRVNAVGVLPMHHVSGLMARVRCADSGGEYVPWDWKRLVAGDFPQLNAENGDWVLSLVPTQLQRLLGRGDGINFLKKFSVVFLGGGPTWPALADLAARTGIRVALSYGMTETAAMIAAQRPEAFALGSRDVGRPMPHVRIEIVDAETSGGGKGDGAAAAGRIRVTGLSVFRGYFPEFDATGVFATEDIGRLTQDGTLEVLGRCDSAIITGGKKVWPAEVEAALLATGLFEDIAVVGVPDEKWGQRVVACYPGAAESVSADVLKQALGVSLSAFKHPKQFVPVTPWPRNAQGKLNRAALLDQIRSFCS